MNYISEDVIIDEKNFDQYFFNVKTNTIKKDQVLAKYSAIAELKSGDDKNYFLQLLLDEGKINSALQYAKNVFQASEKSSIELCINILKDVKKLKNLKEVLNKNHSYLMEIVYYTYPECVPDDQHWSLISVKNINDL